MKNNKRFTIEKRPIFVIEPTFVGNNLQDFGEMKRVIYDLTRNMNEVLKYLYDIENSEQVTNDNDPN